MAFKMKGFKYPGKSPTKLMPVAMPVNAAGAIEQQAIGRKAYELPTEGETKEQEKRRKESEARRRKKKIAERRTKSSIGGNFT
tara:strand:+ start:317 stop:565 length:249 start_codon:yes stop_codon:yes gene_type:complete